MPESKSPRRTASKSPKRASKSPKRSASKSPKRSASKSPKSSAGAKERYFKVLDPKVNKGEMFGRYNSKSPKQAATKAFTAILARRKEEGVSTSGKIHFVLRESTQGSDHKMSYYVGERVDLAKHKDPKTGKPMGHKVVDVKDKKTGQVRQITYKFKNIISVDKVAKAEAAKNAPAKKRVAKKSSAKKPAAKKSAPRKAPAAKKSSTKKPAAKKSAPRKAPSAKKSPAKKHSSAKHSAKKH